MQRLVKTMMTLIRCPKLLERTFRLPVVCVENITTTPPCTSRALFSSWISTRKTTAGNASVGPTGHNDWYQSLPLHQRSFSSGQVSGSDHHAFFQQQLEELNAERNFLFGPSSGGEDDSQSLMDEGNRLKEQQQQQQQQSWEASQKQKDELAATSFSVIPGGDDFDAELEELHAERQALFQFTSQEMTAWQSHSGQSIQTSTLPSELFKEIAQARAAADKEEALLSSSTMDPKGDRAVPSSSGSLRSQPHHHHEAFSHVSRDGQSIHMVDVGPKKVTTRIATAQSKVFLPPEVLQAFHLKDEGGDTAEMVGPKGPIFATAKLAGIMAAK